MIRVEEMVNWLVVWRRREGGVSARPAGRVLY